MEQGLVPLTRQQRRLVEAVRRLGAGGVGPSYGELAGELGLVGTGNVHRLVHGAMERGWLEADLGRWRTLRLTAAALLEVSSGE